MSFTLTKFTMDSTTHSYLILFLVGICSLFLDRLSAERNNQFPSNIATDDCEGSSFFFYQKTEYPRDCSEVLNSCSLSATSGIYLIKPDGYEEPFEAYCNHDIYSGGWTVILRRLDGSVNFKRNWSEYKKGFGFLSAELWLGNDKLSFLTNQAQYEVRIDITLDNGTSCDVSYDAFRISDEWSDYTITSAGKYQNDTACKWEEIQDSGPTYELTSFTDCNDVYSAGNGQDGIYSVRPAGWNEAPFDVFCNMSIDGGNWTVIQRRVDGSTDFYRNWTSYEEGFGNIQHEFWLGNEKLHYMTNQSTYEYRVDFVYSSSSYHNKYSRFRIDDKTNKYKVTDLGSRTGTGGWSLYSTRNREFSTYDQDNDGLSYNCAEEHHSGWWHGGDPSGYDCRYCCYFLSGSKRCSYANLNGDYNGGNGENIFDSHYYCHQKYTEMKIRRVS